MHWSTLVVGLVVGVLMGTFGVGGSSLATPALSVIGVHALAAVASPLPATIPAALTALLAYRGSHATRGSAATWTIVGGTPGVVGGALLSHVVGGRVLLLISGLVLVAIGVRVLRPPSVSAARRGRARQHHRAELIAAGLAIGLFTGLLANGGGFLLVPVYLELFGLDMHEAIATSLAVVAVLSLPTLVMHWSLGHIDWAVAAAFGIGLVPASYLGARWTKDLSGSLVERAFGWLLIAAGAAYTAWRVFG